MFRHCVVVMTDFQKSVINPVRSKKSEMKNFGTFRRFKQKRDLASLGEYFGCGRQKGAK